MENIKLTVNKEELEVLRRGLRHMATEYKNRFAYAVNADEEEKWYGRYTLARDMLDNINSSLDALECFEKGKEVEAAVIAAIAEEIENDAE